MRKSIGILLMEEDDGNIAVQLFSDPDGAAESFHNIVGTITQKPQRATFLKVQYDGGIKVEGYVKELPIPEVPIDKRPDGYRIGDGPVFIEDKK